MIAGPVSERLTYERVSPDHFEALHRMNSDPRVMVHLGGISETREATMAWIANCERRWADQCHGWWALREMESGDVIGAATLQQLDENPDLPLEAGWRLHPDAWGKGFATEAGRAAIQYGHEALGVSRFSAVTAPGNTASQAVMERLGFRFRAVERWYGMDLATYFLDWADLA